MTQCCPNFRKDPYRCVLEIFWWRFIRHYSADPKNAWLPADQIPQTNKQVGSLHVWPQAINLQTGSS